jgi:hypothetical protein
MWGIANSRAPAPEEEILVLRDRPVAAARVGLAQRLGDAALEWEDVAAERRHQPTYSARDWPVRQAPRARSPDAPPSGRWPLQLNSTEVEWSG